MARFIRRPDCGAIDDPEVIPCGAKVLCLSSRATGGRPGTQGLRARRCAWLWVPARRAAALGRDDGGVCVGHSGRSERAVFVIPGGGAAGDPGPKGSAVDGACGSGSRLFALSRLAGMTVVFARAADPPTFVILGLVPRTHPSTSMEVTLDGQSLRRLRPSRSYRHALRRGS
jgi:hypothetical protein